MRIGIRLPATRKPQIHKPEKGYDLALGRLIGEFQPCRAEPFDVDHGGKAVGENAAYGGAGLEGLEFHGVRSPRWGRSPSP